MSVQNVVLGQLIQRRGYGYELADRLKDSTVAFGLSEAAIYGALKGLLRRGLIVEAGRADARPGDWQRGQRVIYEATDSGRSHFRSWMESAPRKAPLREELHMQLLVATEEDVPLLIASLAELQDECREDLARVLALSFEEQEWPHARISRFGAPLVRDALAAHLQATMDWAQRARRSLENRRDAAATGVAGRRRP